MEGAHVALSVTDLSRSGPWYEKVFEAQKIMEETDEHGQIAIFVTGDGLIVGLRQHNGTAAGARFNHEHVGLDHFGYHVADRAAVEKFQTRFDELGVEHSGIVDDPFGSHLNFRDPDNIALEIFATAAQ